MQQQKGAMSKKFLSAEEVARELNVKKFLVRFWEKEFKLKLEHASTGQRGYSQDDLKVFVAIKDLIHNQKMTISQARKQLKATFGDQMRHDDVHNEPDVAAAPMYHELEAIVPAPAIIDDAPCVNSQQVEGVPLVQPAVTPVEGNQLSNEELFMQNLRIFKEQLLNLKQLLDLE